MDSRTIERLGWGGGQGGMETKVILYLTMHSTHFFNGTHFYSQYLK